MHRDLKPANIMMDAAGTAKISDFGLARQHARTTLLTMHPGAGTLAYMAPELLMASTATSAAFMPTNRVDIYAFAMIVWEMLAGRPPWHHVNPQSLRAAVLMRRRPELPGAADDDDSVADGGLDGERGRRLGAPLTEVPASLHALPELNAIIRACWHHTEHKRPSAEVLHAKLVSLMRLYGL